MFKNKTCSGNIQSNKIISFIIYTLNIILLIAEVHDGEYSVDDDDADCAHPIPVPHFYMFQPV
jgi:hypothetical protein